MAADWFKCKGDVWCDLFKINLNHDTLQMTGVFIIWIESGNSRKVLRVGKGDIADELTKCKNDIVMQAFMHKGLKVSFTPVIESQCKSVEVYLYRTLSPTVNGSIPSGLPIKINLPWK
jgi:hypothetical protein